MLENDKKDFMTNKKQNGKFRTTNPPIEGLRELGKKSGINRLSVKKLRKIALEEATKEAVTNME